MKYWDRLEIEDPFLLEGISVTELAEHSEFKQPHLSDMKNNKYIPGKKVYIRLKAAVDRLKALKNKTLDNIQK